MTATEATLREFLENTVREFVDHNPRVDPLENGELATLRRFLDFADNQHEKRLDAAQLEGERP